MPERLLGSAAYLPVGVASFVQSEASRQRGCLRFAHLQALIVGVVGLRHFIAKQNNCASVWDVQANPDGEQSLNSMCKVSMEV